MPSLSNPNPYLGALAGARKVVNTTAEKMNNPFTWMIAGDYYSRMLTKMEKRDKAHTLSRTTKKSLVDLVQIMDPKTIDKFFGNQTEAKALFVIDINKAQTAVAQGRVPFASLVLRFFETNGFDDVLNWFCFVVFEHGSTILIGIEVSYITYQLIQVSKNYSENYAVGVRDYDLEYQKFLSATPNSSSSNFNFYYFIEKPLIQNVLSTAIISISQFENDIFSITAQSEPEILGLDISFPPSF